MDLVMEAMKSLLSKLVGLLREEYKLQQGVKEDVRFLERELTSMHATLDALSTVRRDMLAADAKVWADHVLELSYKLEVMMDTFVVRAEYPAAAAAGDPNCIKRLGEKLAGLVEMFMARRQIAAAIKRIKNEVQDVAARRDRYKLPNSVVANNPAAATTTSTTVDPRDLSALYNKVTDLVGIDQPRDELIRMLSEDGVRIVSIGGFGGLGKTTLAKAVYDSLKPGFDCVAFVSVSQNPDITRIFKKMLHQLDEEKHAGINEASRDQEQLTNELRNFLNDKRYLIVIDDIWKIQSWETIKFALGENISSASRIITTTRDFGIAKQVGGFYRLNPLTQKSSEILFHGRIYGSKEKCPKQLAKVSLEILKKCGGIPLAIIAVASRLAVSSKRINLNEWEKVSESIGHGLGDSPDLKKMRDILSLSYYNLPLHLRACLLYLSIYPEDYEIPKDDLIWKWIAEGFVQHNSTGDFLFEVGDSYFSELINRGMVQPCVDYKGEVKRCCLHDMVLDLICSLSREQKIVTILNHVKGSTSSQSNNVHRLSLQNRNEDHQTTPLPLMSSMAGVFFTRKRMSMEGVRSITTFPPAINLMLPLSSFDVLRVLDLGRCFLGGGNLNLKHVGKLFHLRYLCLADTNITVLPEEIGKLQLLQVLDVSNNSGLEELPLSVYKLKRLMCLLVDGKCEKLTGRLGNLTCMEVLRNMRASLETAKELRKLASLRELKIKFEHGASSELGEAFVESLCNLRNIQSLVIRGHLPSMDLLGERWVPPRHLRVFDSEYLSEFSRMPAWIKRDPFQLSDLSEVVIGFTEVSHEDLRILASLPALRRLWIWSAQQTRRVLRVGANGFNCVTTFTLYCGSAKQIVFEQGALPSAELVLFNFSVRAAKGDGNAGFDFGLRNLLSLRRVIVGVDRDGGVTAVGEVMEAVAALRHAVAIHPNHPAIIIDVRPSIPREEQESGGVAPRSVGDEELVGEAKKFREKFRKFRAKNYQSITHSNSRSI